MKVQKTLTILALCVACHHGAGSRAAAPARQPNVELDHAMGMLRHGD